MNNNEQRIIELYQQGHGQQYCAKHVFGNTNVQLVKQILYKHKVHIRNKAEALTLLPQNRPKYVTDITFFQRQTKDMAWILGFIAADGTIGYNTNRIKITVAKKDEEILWRIRQKLQSNYPIKSFVTDKGYENVSFSWTCQTHKEDLAKFYVVPKKTLTLRFPDTLERKYWIDYIRGFFDGDGSVNFIRVQGKKAYTALRWQLCSAAPGFLEHIIEFLSEEYGIKKVNIQVRRGIHDLYVCQYSTNATKALYSILYNDLSGLYLLRKQHHYLKILHQINNK